MPDHKHQLAEVVHVNPEVMHGVLCFTGTRVPVQMLLDYLENDGTIEEFLNDFPRVKREQAIQFLELGKEYLLACVSC